MTSSREAPRKAAAITASATPSPCSRNGSSTPATPKPTDGSATIPIAGTVPGARTASRSRPGSRSGTGALCRREIQRPVGTSATIITPRPMNARRGPISVASAPTAGPTHAPALAAAKASPISRPRSAGEPSDTSHGIVPAQTAAAQTPVRARAASSVAGSPAAANARHESPTSIRPPSATARCPSAPTSAPAGTDAATVAERVARAHHPGGQAAQVQRARVDRQQRAEHDEEQRLDQQRQQQEPEQQTLPLRHDRCHPCCRHAICRWASYPPAAMSIGSRGFPPNALPPGTSGRSARHRGRRRSGTVAGSSTTPPIPDRLTAPRCTTYQVPRQEISDAIPNERTRPPSRYTSRELATS